MRNPGTVLDRIRAVDGIPEELQNELDSIGDSLRYCAPENMNFIWGRLGEAVSLAVKNKPYEYLRGWETEIVDILTGRK